MSTAHAAEVLDHKTTLEISDSQVAAPDMVALFTRRRRQTGGRIAATDATGRKGGESFSGDIEEFLAGVSEGGP
jgi:hypothetical protein